ncbi:MAG: hypothetical protein HY036_05570, partial [Nitrospirae bacterium]|nr:hypothetical protein [Nitrospirota bacterium]
KTLSAPKTSTTLKIGFLSNQKSKLHHAPVMIELFRILKDRGVKEEIIVPGEELINISSISVVCDTYVLVPGDELSLSFAGIFHDKGGRILNSFPASSFVHDKVRVAFKLQEAGLPVPSSFIAGDIRQVFKQGGKQTVIIKPHREIYGERSQIVYAGEDSQFIFPGAYFAQEFFESDHENIKAYVIGEEVFAIKRAYRTGFSQAHSDGPFPASDSGSRQSQSRRYELSGEVRKMVLTCGRIFNLHIYGVDLLEIEKGLFITDVTSFPDFSEVPSAAGPLADYIFNYALGL